MNRLFRSFSFFLFLLSCVSVDAQQDPQAKKVLDQFARKSKSYKTVQIIYTLTVDDRKDKHKSATKGNLVMKGQNFKLETSEYVVFSDGKSVWNYLKQSNEVNVSKASNGKKDEDIFLSNPAKLFSIYKSDYKYQFIVKENVKGKQCFIIDLFPVDIRRSYARIRMVINSVNYELVTAVAFGKSGVIYEFNVDKLSANTAINDNDLKFNKAKFPGVEVNDMRF
jgi:outer membrane lipoprotein carrier protein